MNSEFYRNKKILVAGSSGFIGKNLILNLSKMGAIVRGTYLHHKPDVAIKNVEFMRCDFTSAKQCLSATKGIEYVFMYILQILLHWVMEKTPLSSPYSKYYNECSYFRGFIY